MIGPDVDGGSRLWKFGYDAADQQESALKSNVTSGLLEGQFGYRYDGSGNRTVEQIDAGVTTASFNSLNQMTGRSGGGEALIRGTISEPGTVTVAGRQASVEADQSFSVWVPVTPGANNLSLVATDGSGNPTSKTLSFTASGGTTATHSYDKAGHLLSDGERAYDWDAAGRMIKITQGASVTEFVYDGLGRRKVSLSADSSTAAASASSRVRDASRCSAGSASSRA